METRKASLSGEISLFSVGFFLAGLAETLGVAIVEEGAR